MKFKKLAKLSFSDWRALLLALVALPLIALSLRTKGYKWTRQRLHPNTTATESPPAIDQLVLAQSISRMVFLAAIYGPYRANCLKKSLTTWWLLGRRGIPSTLKIGVNKQDGDFNAHAWVEYQGHVLLDTADVGERFSAFKGKGDSPL